MKKNKPSSIIAVVGGAGAMGRITVRDLLETAPANTTILIADYDVKRAERLFGPKVFPKFKSRIQIKKIDASNPKAAAKVLRGSAVVINATKYQWNLFVMQACLLAKAHYVDMGGLFHVTKKQLKLHGAFKKAGLTALLGLGAAPGITNMLAKKGADALDRVSEIHTRVANSDETVYEPKPALAVAYSLKTILEEFSFPPAVHKNGKTEFVEPMSGDEPMRFPLPIGERRPMYTIHSEVATLPASFKHKGVKEVSFKIAFDPEFLHKVRFLRDLGLASHHPIEVAAVNPKGMNSGKRALVLPVDVVDHVAMSQPETKVVGALKQFEVIRAIVVGEKNGKPLTLTVDCQTQGLPEWGFGVDVDTGCPPSIVGQMLAQGEISIKGVYPPELSVPVDRFFEELAKRKMPVTLTQS